MPNQEPDRKRPAAERLNKPEVEVAETSYSTDSWLTGRLRCASPGVFSAYCISAAFTTYFCMYAFRKPFTAAAYEPTELWGVGYKSILVASQVAGYTLSKFIGIKVISEMPASRRALGIMLLIGIAELALLAFAIVPPPYNFPLLFLNGLPLGMVFGLVLAYLEGRRLTEALSAGLCASFIVSSGVVKSVGRSLIVDFQIAEYWMPALTGLIFTLPLLVGVYMLSQIPAPSVADIQRRSQRLPMTRRERIGFLRRHSVGLVGLLLAYILLTMMRSLRDDFALEIWQDMEKGFDADVFGKTELMVMVGVTVVNGAAIWIASNRIAFLSAIGLVIGGFGLVIGALNAYHRGYLEPFNFMVLIGFGMYVPYVAYHTTVFERLIAAFQERANIGYLMYLADATGYLAYVGLMIWSNRAADEVAFLDLFLQSSFVMAAASIVVMMVVGAYYLLRLPRETDGADVAVADAS